jgi:1-acyl-sn-glycerol-3-phosphate acyltransferase
MFKRLDRAWRLCATAFCFALFGTGAVAWITLFPLVAAFLGRGPHRKRRARRLMHGVLGVYLAILRGVGLLTYEVRNAERLNRPGRLVVANHPSLLDAVFLISLIPNATCIVKPALARNLFLRVPIRTVDYVYATDANALLNRCAAELSQGSSLIVFPEGTRTPPAEVRPFQRGAANVALRSGAPILPVYIHCSPSWLTKRDRWYYVPPARVHYTFHVGEEIKPRLRDEPGNRAIASRKLTQYLQSYFLEQAKIHG